MDGWVDRVDISRQKRSQTPKRINSWCFGGPQEATKISGQSQPALPRPYLLNSAFKISGVNIPIIMVAFTIY